MARRQLRIVQGGSVPGVRGALAPVDRGGIAEELAANEGLREVLERGLSAIVGLTGARAGAIRIAPPGAERMKLVSSVGLPPEVLEAELSVEADCGVCGQSLHTRQFQVETKPFVCARRMGFPDEGGELGPMLALPLHSQGRVIGVFNLLFPASGRVPQDLERLLAPVADMLDLVLDNALREAERLRSSLSAERQMFAGEVHDSLAQGLAFMRMRMSLLQDAIREGRRDYALKYFRDVNDSLGEAHGRLRELITHFRQEVDRQGLLRALEETALTFAERTGVELRIENRAPGLKLAPETEEQAFRIVQEALANVIKHAGARGARVLIERDEAQVRISVEDDGRGARIGRRARGEEAGGHYGLEIMRERAGRIGGRLEIRSAPGQGTRVSLVLPATVAD